MVDVIRDPGIGDSMADIAQILQVMGNAEESRQTRMAAEEILTALSSGNDNALDMAVQKAATFRATRSPGLQGFLQAIGSANMTGNPGVNALQGTGLPIVKTKADIAESKARQGYYGQGGRSTQNPWVRDAAGNARQLKPGEQPQPGEEPFRPDTELTDVERDVKEAELEAILMGQRRLTQDPAELAGINANLTAIRQRRSTRGAKPPTASPAASAAPRKIETANMRTGEVSVNGQPTGQISPDFPGRPTQAVRVRGPQGVGTVTDPQDIEAIRAGKMPGWEIIQ